MYQQFYGFNKIPFSSTSEPHFFFDSASHREACAAIKYGIGQRKGIILVTGEVGTGKTTLCKKVIEDLDKNVKISLILNPFFTDSQLLQAIVEDFGIHTEKKTKLDLVKALNHFLIQLHSTGGNAVLIIDEAQHLSARQLEQVRLLSNLETSEEKLLQLVLMGQPELTEKLNQYKLRQIRQRIFVKYQLSPLAETEVEKYMTLRLKNAGKDDFDIKSACYKIIYEFSGGVPRLINMLCDRALLMGYARGQNRWDENILKDSIKEIL
ncbi:MAG: AAA family ATPase [Candidatus Omnitrophica bacterium]|nr:AAA family ATPase [Candidatus Omnitrophota bacterium]